MIKILKQRNSHGLSKYEVMGTVLIAAGLFLLIWIAVYFMKVFLLELNLQKSVQLSVSKCMSLQVSLASDAHNKLGYPSTTPLYEALPDDCMPYPNCLPGHMGNEGFDWVVRTAACMVSGNQHNCENPDEMYELPDNLAGGRILVDSTFCLWGKPGEDECCFSNNADGADLCAVAQVCIEIEPVLPTYPGYDNPLPNRKICAKFGAVHVPTQDGGQILVQKIEEDKDCPIAAYPPKPPVEPPYSPPPEPPTYPPSPGSGPDTYPVPGTEPGPAPYPAPEPGPYAEPHGGGGGNDPYPELPRPCPHPPCDDEPPCPYPPCTKDEDPCIYIVEFGRKNKTDEYSASGSVALDLDGHGGGTPDQGLLSYVANQLYIDDSQCYESGVYCTCDIPKKGKATVAMLGETNSNFQCNGKLIAYNVITDCTNFSDAACIPGKDDYGVPTMTGCLFQQCSQTRFDFDLGGQYYNEHGIGENTPTNFYVFFDAYGNIVSEALDDGGARQRKLDELIAQGKVLCGSAYSPISLLWGDNAAMPKDPTATLFAINPADKGKWSQWYASAETPLLVHDPEHTGQVTSAKQLFGNYTFGQYWNNGYDALATLDKNKDQKISGKELKSLALWFDRNRDGVSDRGEVIPLDIAQVVEIFLQPDEIDVATNNIHAKLGYTRIIDGKKVTGETVDWYGKGGFDTAEEALKAPRPIYNLAAN